jgi:hypothetical protein
MSIRHRQFRRWVLSAYAALFCAAASSQSLSPAMYLPIAASVVRVEVERQQGGLSVGSGVTVAPSVVATSCHVVRDAVGIRIAGSGATWNVDGQYADVRRDVCFLRAPSWPGKPVEFAQASSVRPGAQVAALGFTGGAAITPRFGNILALHGFDGGRIVESSAPFNSGSSGGGLFDAGGALIGLLTFRLRNSQVSYYSIPAKWVREGLPGEGQWTSVRPLEGAPPFWQGDAAELPYFMRAKALEAKGEWKSLLDLAQQWATASPAEGEPLLVRAQALLELHQPRAAVAAYHDASRIAPDALEDELARSLASRLEALVALADGG